MHNKRPVLNAGALFDIPTGKFIDGLRSEIDVDMLTGGKVTQLPVWTGNYNRNTGLSMMAFNIINERLRNTPPSTPERYELAIKLFNLMGYGVKQKDPTKEPEVFWTDFDGDGKDTAEMIRNVLHKDYAVEIAERARSAEAITESMKRLVTDTIQSKLVERVTEQVFGEGTFIVADSYSPLREQNTQLS